MDETNPDWAPTLHLGHSEVRASQSDRYERRLKRKKRGEEMRGILFGTAEGEAIAEIEEVAGMDIIEGHQNNDHVMEPEGCLEPVQTTEEVCNDILTDGHSEAKTKKIECESCELRRAEIDCWKRTEGSGQRLQRKNWIYIL